MTIRITNDQTAAEYLAQAGVLESLQLTDDNKVVEHKACGRCGGTGIYSSYHGKCYDCGGVRPKWVVHTPIKTYARKVKSEESAKRRRALDTQRRHEDSLERQRNWCEENGYGRVTFDEKRAAQQTRWADEHKARAAKSAHVGTIGKREEFTVRVERIVSLGYSSYCYGAAETLTELMKLTTEDNFAMVWISGSRPVALRKGALIRVKVTPKEHSDYKGEKQTKVSRLKIIEVIEEGEAPEEDE